MNTTITFSATPTERIVAMHHDQIVRLNGAVRLRIARGTVWLTVTGEPEDHLLQPGDHFALARGREALVQPLSSRASMFVVGERETPWTQGVAAALQKALLAARRQLAGAWA